MKMTIFDETAADFILKSLDHGDCFKMIENGFLGVVVKPNNLSNNCSPGYDGSWCAVNASADAAWRAANDGFRLVLDLRTYELKMLPANSRVYKLHTTLHINEVVR